MSRQDKRTMSQASVPPTDRDYLSMSPAFVLGTLAAAGSAGLAIEALAPLVTLSGIGNVRIFAAGIAVWTGLMAAREFHVAWLIARDPMFGDDRRERRSLSRLTAAFGLPTLAIATLCASVALSGASALLLDNFWKE